MALFLDPSRTFHVVQSVPPDEDGFCVVGIFSEMKDAEELAGQYRASEIHGRVGVIQSLPASSIIDLLLQDRLRELAAPLSRLIDGCPPARGRRA